MSARVARLVGAPARVALVLAVLLAPASGGVERAAAAGPEAAFAADLAGILASHRSPQRPAEEVLTARIAGLGPQYLHPAFEILAERVVPVTAGEAQILSRPQRAILLAAFERTGRTETLAAEESWRPQHDDDATRTTRIWIRGAVGGPADFPVLFELASATDIEETRRVEEALRSSVEALLRRDEQALPRLRQAWRDLRADLLPCTLEAVGAVRDPRAIELFIEVLTGRPDLAALVMSQVRLTGPGPSPEVNASLAEQLRPQLDVESPQRCAAAAIALAVLEDGESIPRLLTLLDQDSAGLRENGAWALRELTGMRFPPDSSVWMRWYRQELDWNRQGKPAALAKLRSLDAGVVTAGVRELSRHRLYRHALAGELTRLLESRDARLRITACMGLQQLGSRRVLLNVAALLEDPNPQVQDAARTAIAVIADIDATDEIELERVLLELAP